MPSTNFQQWNPSCNNQENDASYTGDSQRSGGAATGSPFASSLANKLFYQVSLFLTAFANMLVSKGFSPNDGSASPGSALANLQAILNNVCVNGNDITNALGYAAANLAFLGQLNNIRIQFGGATGGSVVFATPFSGTPAVAFSTIGSGSDVLISVSATGFTYGGGSGGSISWIAVGPK